MAAVLPSPPSLGFSESQFPSWRPKQDEAILRVIDSSKRIVVECQATGAGKSLSAMAIQKLTGLRTIVLTRRKGLQTQYLSDFPDLEDVRGQNSYPCIYS